MRRSERRSRLLWAGGKHVLAPWLLVLLPLLVYLAILAYPLLASIVLSFTEWSGLGQGPSFVGFRNYVELFSRGTILHAVRNNLTWLILSVPVPAVVGFILAYWLREQNRRNTILRSCFYLPMILSNAVLALIWMNVYDPRHGLLREILTFLHLPAPVRSFLTRPGTAIVAIAVAGIWHWIGFPLVIYLAAIQDIPKQLLEAAELDGASRFQQLRHIVIPLVGHATIIVVALGAILSMKVFDLIYLLTGGYYKNDVVGTLIWRIAFEQFKLGKASAVAVVQFLIIAVMVIPYVLLARRQSEVEL